MSKTLGITAGYSNARTMTFKYEQVLEDHINLDDLDQYLSTCSFRLDGTTVTNALIDDAVFVITSTLKTTRLTVNATGESGRKIGLDVPLVSGIASGTLSVDTSRATEGTSPTRAPNRSCSAFRPSKSSPTTTTATRHYRQWTRCSPVPWRLEPPADRPQTGHEVDAQIGGVLPNERRRSQRRNRRRLAEYPVVTMNNWAVVIGVNRYASARLNLKGAVRDALAVAAYLTEGPTPLVEGARLRLLLSRTDDSPNPPGAFDVVEASRKNIVATMNIVTKPEGRLLVHFSGHGLMAPGLTGGEAILPTDYDAADPVQSIQIDGIRDYLRRPATSTNSSFSSMPVATPRSKGISTSDRFPRRRIRNGCARKSSSSCSVPPCAA